MDSKPGLPAWRRSAWIVSACGVFWMTPNIGLRAQERPVPPPPDVIQLEPVDVTARKRREPDQTTPISVTVIDRKTMDIPPTASNAGVARSAPNTSFVDVGGQSTNFFNIRGGGSFSPLSSDDTTAVVYVGDMPQSVYGVAADLLDVERVEVLRGPQGTLFGRNTQAGAINIVPRPPTFDQSFAVTGEIGTRGYRLGELVANTPLVADRLAARFAARYTAFGGDIPNVVAGGKDGALNITATRGSLMFTPGDRTTATLAISYNRQNDTAPRFLLRDAASFPVSAADPRTKVSGDSLGLTLKVSHDFGPLVLDWISGFQRNDSSQRLDQTDGLVFSRLTGLPGAVFNVKGADIADIAIRENTYLQEVRLSASPDKAVAWTAGFNFFRSEVVVDRFSRAAVPAFQRLNGSQANRFSTNSYSAFGEVTVPVVDGLKATMGLRLSREDKRARYRFQGNGLPGVVTAFSQNGSQSDGFATGRVALSYDWSAGLMTYVSVARGYVTGGFPAIASNTPQGRPEATFPASASWTYEVGFKSTWLNRRLAVKGALFFNDVRDGHLVVFDPARLLFTTAALDYRSYGGEVEFAARLAPGFDLYGGVGYTHARLRDVPSGSLTGARSGNDVPNVPALTASLGGQYRLPGSTLGIGGEVLLRANWQYVGARPVDVANSFNLKSYHVVNARLGWEGEHVGVHAFAYNLFNSRYETFGQSFGPTTQSVRVGQGRIVGIGTTIKF
ncbi:TonB-dependent receptor [Reyranella sp. CPCC 100927]|uniref:TonB-dependent receptor n=1 Tax=Reyranella sp. CPCC 100927 TaxID=2599616 RepID=UPI001C49C1C7|nr:TonB-dependent receptor [Reyranella sp. CPCC 100927]